jgi:hypothetical protein
MNVWELCSDGENEHWEKVEVVKATPKRVYTTPVGYGGDTYQPYYDRQKLEHDGCAVYVGRRPGCAGIFQWVWTDSGKAATDKA